MIKLTKLQKDIADKATAIIREKHLCYFAIEMRVGKTLIALETANRLKKKSVLFITKKKVIAGVNADYLKRKHDFKMKVICNSYQAIDKEIVNRENYDLIILDEAHCYGAFPKPNRNCLSAIKLVNDIDVIFLSGTPSPESSGSQLFFQLAISKYSVFAPYGRSERSFYKWAKDYVKIKQIMIGGRLLKNYSNADFERILKETDCIMIKASQTEAGIKSEIKEHAITIKAPSDISMLIELLKKDKYIKAGKFEIVADSTLKEMQKLHQIGSGTVICENGEAIILSDYKARYIVENFKQKKIAIFYVFNAEGELLRHYFRNYTEDPNEFNNSKNKVFICQITKGSMGISLKTADVLIFYNLCFSSVHYWQGRARMASYDRNSVQNVYYLFSDCGLESKVYNAVINKKSFTTNYYRRYGK